MYCKYYSQYKIADLADEILSGKKSYQGIKINAVSCNSDCFRTNSFAIFPPEVNRIYLFKIIIIQLSGYGKVTGRAIFYRTVNKDIFAIGCD